MIEVLNRFTARVSAALAWVAGACLVAMMLLACANIVLRAVWVPLEGTFEIMGFLGAVASAFSMAYAQLNRSHIAVGLVTGRFPRPVRRTLDGLTTLVSCGLFLLLAVQTARWALFLIATGETSETLRIPYHPFVFAAALGCLVTALALFADFLNLVSGRSKA